MSNAKMLECLDNLPTVISCCFCCFLRAGTVMIGMFSFFIGLIFAPNMSHARGFWDMETVLSNYSFATESAVQMTLGVLSIMLCCVSILLMIGACCNMPYLILIYEWGAMVYSGSVVVLFSVLASFCFFVHTNCALAGGLLVALIVVDILVTAYFIVVVNSLRISLQFLGSEEYKTQMFKS